jgi:hypothetical protein
MGAARYWLDRRGGPEWNPPRDAPETPYEADDESAEERVQFYLPTNGRDQPEPEPPTIDGEIFGEDVSSTGTDG